MMERLDVVKVEQRIGTTQQEESNDKEKVENERE